jgi:hypothetical protein
MGLDGGGKNNDVDARVCGQQLREIVENGNRLRKPPLDGRVGVRHGDKFDGAGFLKPCQVGKVAFTESVDAYQGYAWNSRGVSGARVVPGRVHAAFRGGGLLIHEDGPCELKVDWELEADWELEVGWL